MKSTTKKHEFFAPDIEILRLCDTPDAEGLIVPEGAKIAFKVAQKLYYGEVEIDHLAGFARLRRTAKAIVGDLTLYSTMPKQEAALKLMRKLYPSCEFLIKDATGFYVTDLEIKRVFLTPNRNSDYGIAPIGSRVRKKLSPSEIH